MDDIRYITLKVIPKTLLVITPFYLCKRAYMIEPKKYNQEIDNIDDKNSKLYYTLGFFIVSSKNTAKIVNAITAFSFSGLFCYYLYKKI